MGAQHRAENLFGPQATGNRYVRVNRRVDEPARVTQHIAAGHAVQAFAARDGEVLRHLAHCA